MERLSAPSGYKGPQPAVKPDLVGKLVKCSHVFHLHCLVAMYNNGNKVRGCGPGAPPAQPPLLSSVSSPWDRAPAWLAWKTLRSHPDSEFHFYQQQALGEC